MPLTSWPRYLLGACREVMTKLGDTPLTHEEVDDMMRTSGVRGDGEITLEEFKTMLLNNN
jgi:Ca2+-binding EF-hand superfamily protein